MKIVFFGTPDFAAICLEQLLNSCYKNIISFEENINNLQAKVVGVVTQPDKKTGRGQKLQFLQVKQITLGFNKKLEKFNLPTIPILQPQSLQDKKVLKRIYNLQPDILVVVAYGLILPKDLLDYPRLGAINVHASILPKWRGAAPIQRAIEAGDKETGISIMQMDEGLDTGDILQTKKIAITNKDTSATLYYKLSNLGASLLIATLQNFIYLQAKKNKQNSDLATYARKLSKNEAMLNLDMSTIVLLNKIHAFNPFPIAKLSYSTCNDSNPQQLKIYIAQKGNIEYARKLILKNPILGKVAALTRKGIIIKTKDGFLELLEVQLAGKKVVSGVDFANALKQNLSSLIFY